MTYQDANNLLNLVDSIPAWRRLQVYILILHLQQDQEKLSGLTQLFGAEFIDALWAEVQELLRKQGVDPAQFD